MRIAARFNGPPGSGNGGYSAGLLAVELGLAPAEVTLRRPLPLDTDLAVVRAAAAARVLAGDTLIAEARPAPAQRPDAVPPVPLSDAAEASKDYPGLRSHPFPTCYVCGTGRDDGLALRPGILPDGRTAAPWHVPGDICEPTLWAALDCPGGWSVIAPSGGRPYVLGRISAWIDALPRPGDTCVVVGRHIGGGGRKADVLSTVYSPDGVVLATAHATWIALPPATD
ncbi:hotdog fold domain-containing protein [Dactylosporangium sp. NPDC051484]|uniref:hotdog fold domain-containing protein n=1 Tax=Dactylosporangium sp. NPDC051484 TaxID=3154942 RepID=UPI00344EB90F